MGKYAGVWQDHATMQNDTSYGEALPKPEEIVYAVYNQEYYEGYATIVFTRDGKLWENNDSHCSCYGLETWSPEETTPEALRLRPETGYNGLPELGSALSEAGF